MKQEPLTFPEPPEYSPCWFCQLEGKGNVKYQGMGTRETEVQYACPNHKPLYVDWYCVRMTAGKWFFNRIIITLPGHFRLYWNFHAGPRVDLQEWMKAVPNKHGSHWKTINSNPNGFPFQPRWFDPEWVLSQDTQRLHKFLELYRVFS
jgi:hypothetical protein